MNGWIIASIALLTISIVLNIFLVSYIRLAIARVFVISETSAEIFTRLNSFEEHLRAVYGLPTFYEDETLSGLLDHAKSLSEYLYQFDGLHSFTQPDLIEQLEEASIELQEKHDQEEAAEEKE